MPWYTRLLVTKLYVVYASPEVGCRCVTAIWAVESGEGCICREISKANDCRVISHIDITLVAARLKHESIPTLTPLTIVAIATHFVPYLINSALAIRVSWTEDSHSIFVPLWWVWFSSKSCSEEKACESCDKHLVESFI